MELKPELKATKVCYKHTYASLAHDYKWNTGRVASANKILIVVQRSCVTVQGYSITSKGAKTSEVHNEILNLSVSFGDSFLGADIRILRRRIRNGPRVHQNSTLCQWKSQIWDPSHGGRDVLWQERRMRAPRRSQEMFPWVISEVI